MFGFAVPDMGLLSDENKARVKRVYCGICRGIGTVGRPRERAALSYDLVLLALTLSDVYGVPFEEAFSRCERHPFKKQPLLTNAFSSYAAEMNILLAYYHFQDDVKDEGGVSPRLMSALFRRDATAVSARYPALTKQIVSCLDEISDAEKHDIPDPEVPANAFGMLLGAVFAEKPAGVETDVPLETHKRLFAFGFTLGKAIYLLDAAADIKPDLRKKAYNPLIRSSPDHRMRLMELTLSQALDAYRALEPKTDAAIVENVLLSGVWSAYALKSAGRKRKGERAEAPAPGQADQKGGGEDE